MSNTGKIKNVIGVKRELRGKRYAITGKTNTGVPLGTIEGMSGQYILHEDLLEPADENGITNADRIRSMSDEVLAKELVVPFTYNNGYRVDTAFCGTFSRYYGDTQEEAEQAELE